MAKPKPIKSRYYCRLCKANIPFSESYDSWLGAGSNKYECKQCRKSDPQAANYGIKTEDPPKDYSNIKTIGCLAALLFVIVASIRACACQPEPPPGPRITWEELQQREAQEEFAAEVERQKEHLKQQELENIEIMKKMAARIEAARQLEKESKKRK